MRVVGVKHVESGFQLVGLPAFRFRGEFCDFEFSPAVNGGGLGLLDFDFFRKVWSVCDEGVVFSAFAAEVDVSEFFEVVEELSVKFPTQVVHGGKVFFYADYIGFETFVYEFIQDFGGVSVPEWSHGF